MIRDLIDWLEMKFKNWTPIEFMIVLAVIGILAAIVVPKAADLKTRYYVSKRLQGRFNGDRLPEQRVKAVVRQYSADGERVGEWHVAKFVSRTESRVKFLTVDDKLVTVSGSYVVEE